MSWLFGLIADEIDDNERGRLGRIHPSALHRVDKPTLYLAAGGLPETCLAGTFRTTDEETGWLMVGLGIQSDESPSRFATAADVSRLLSSETVNLDDLNGHFLIVRWSRTRLICQSDPLGLRTLYVRPHQKGTYVSTRLDWLASATGGLDVDFSAFGSHWLGANQYSFRSLARGVTRLGPGSTVRCTSASVRHTSDPWSPSIRSDSSRTEASDAGEVLRPYLRPQLSEGQRLSLGLSGGLDSRTLLAILLEDESSFGVHIFGDPGHPDARVAARIAHDKQLACEVFPEPLQGKENILRELSEYSAVANATGPASTIAKLSVYPQLHHDGFVCIDGFFGEVARRQYFNRLLKRRREAFTASAEELIHLVHTPRPQFFSAETQRIMRSGMIQDFEAVLAWHRSIESITDEDFADLLAIRFRLPNFAGYEQARLDARAVTYMPFTQRPFLEWALRLPHRERRGGKAFRRAIDATRPSLTNYPLVKGGTTYPYALKTLPAWVWTNVKARIGLSYKESGRSAFLASIEEYVRDTVRSRRVKSCGAYDYDKVLTTVEAFYEGDESLAGFVDWWIAFEEWRKSLSGE